MIKYQGIFFNVKDIQNALSDKQSHEIQISNPHITFDYFGEESSEGKRFTKDMLGLEFEVEVIGYGISEENEGFLVKLPAELMQHYHGAENIHITTSLTEHAKAVNTANLCFLKIEPFKLKGSIDYYPRAT